MACGLPLLGVCDACKACRLDFIVFLRSGARVVWAEQPGKLGGLGNEWRRRHERFLPRCGLIGVGGIERQRRIGIGRGFDGRRGAFG